MRLYENKILLFVFMLVVSILTLVLFFDNSDISNNSINANVVNTHVEVLPVEPKNCSFQLHAGWNLISIYCLGMLNERVMVLQSVNNSYGSIFSYQSRDLTDPWKSYNASLPNWTIQQLTHMDRVSGYWIYMYNATTLYYAGIYYDSNIPLRNGWNLVGYPKNRTTNINDSLNGISFSVVEYYDTQTNTWMYYYQNGSSNTLTQFEPYEGYWINVSGLQQWNITRN